jgi:GT2 family glycosyltransferase
VALLNPDAYPDATWLQELVTHAERNPAFASFGSKMFSDLEREHLDGVGDTYHVSGLPRRRGHGQRDVGQFDGNAEIFGPCAAAGLYSTGALSAVCDDDGCVLDEDFFVMSKMWILRSDSGWQDTEACMSAAHWFSMWVQAW